MEITAVSVSEITNRIKSVLETDFSSVKIVGEISNFKQATSGHRYFTLKDEFAQISCVMWRTRNLTFEPTDGMKVTASGALTVYPPRGNYQLDTVSLQPLGQGDLYLAFEKLKKELFEHGYFDDEIKKEIPKFPVKIGVSTSGTGAAIRDIFSTLERRLPFAEIYFQPVKVQGDGSAEEITAAIEKLDKMNLDVIIIGRGGGSLEDLWSYNTRLVADAIYNAKTPIVSGVGHETDITISDMVADLRAPTPTGAAELISRNTIDILHQYLDSAEVDLKRIMEQKIKNMRDILDRRVDRINDRRIKSMMQSMNERIDELESRLNSGMRRKMKDLKTDIESKEQLIKSLNPEQPLEKGFALISKNGKTIKANEKLSIDDTVAIKRKLFENKAKITE